MKIKMFAVSLVLYVAALAVSAQVVLPPVFADGMVLQQNSTIAIWGKSAPASEVSVKAEWDSEIYSTKTGADSLWRVSVQTPLASYKPYSVAITTKGRTVTLNDVLIGEVWLCGGQSNMEMAMNGFRMQPIVNSAVEIASSRNDNLRVFSVERNASVDRVFDAPGGWVKASPNTTGQISATGYYFGRMLQQALDVPVGLLVCCYGGSVIEAWIPREALAAEFPSFKLPTTNAEVVKPTSTPAVLYDGMMYSIEGYGIKGAIWYQGESSRKLFAQYPELFRTMHSEWQKRWDVGTFPIYLAQIAPFTYAPRGEISNTAFIREAMVEIAKTQPNTGIAILMDLGQENIIHPERKMEVGQRLALQAMAKSYGMTSLQADSPIFKSVKFDGSKGVVLFDKAPSALFAKGDLVGFELAGADKKFYPAKATIAMATVEVESAQVPKPVAVRYCFKSFAVGTLFGGNGLPVSSFRSDNWNDIL